MKLYRYEDTLTDRNFAVKLRKFDTIKETPQGYWIKYCKRKSHKKWISKTSRKRFCYPTEKEAWASYLARKKSQLTHAKTSLEATSARLIWIEQNKPEPPNGILEMSRHNYPDWY